MRKPFDAGISPPGISLSMHFNNENVPQKDLQPDLCSGKMPILS